jgi:hypothetical protein
MQKIKKGVFLLGLGRRLISDDYFWSTAIAIAIDLKSAVKIAL